MRTILLVTTILVIGMLPGGALAGSVTHTLVEIFPNAFDGVVTQVRSSSNTLENISCSVASTTVVCSARNAGGTSKACASTNAAHMANARAINLSSFVTVNFDNAGHCTEVRVENGSQFSPKL